MSTQVLSAQLSTEAPELQAWVRLLHAHAGTTRRLSAELVARHGLTLNDYEVLLRLRRTPDRRMRRVDLAESVLLTPSGMTRLLDGLERAGLVCRAECASDGRVSYAVLTDAGERKLVEAWDTHVAGIRELFAGRFSPDELASLASLLARLPGAGGEGECGAVTPA